MRYKNEVQLDISACAHSNANEHAVLLVQASFLIHNCKSQRASKCYPSSVTGLTIMENEFYGSPQGGCHMQCSYGSSCRLRGDAPQKRLFSPRAFKF